MSGRALFSINPDLFEDADDAGVEDIVFESDEEAEETKESQPADRRDADGEEEKKEADDEMAGANDE